MCSPKNIYQFLAYAKSCACEMSCKYVENANHGYDVYDDLNKIRLLDSYIKSINNYLYPSCNDFYFDGKKHLGGKKVYASKNNSLYLSSKDTKIKISSKELNCLTEEQVCDLAHKIREICINC